MTTARATFQSSLNHAADRAAIYLWHLHITGHTSMASLAQVEVIRCLRNACALSTRVRNLTTSDTNLASLAINVLRRVLEHLDLVDRIALSQTCHFLRTKCAQIHSAWGTVSLQEDAQICRNPHRNGHLPYYLVGSHRHSLIQKDLIGGLVSFLSFSPSKLLDLDISAALCSRLVSVLEDVIGRTANVSLNVFAWCRIQETRSSWDHHVEHNVWIVDRPRNTRLETFADSLRAPAPHLHSLSFTVSSGNPCIQILEAFELPVDFLGGDPALLRSCRIGGIWLQPTTYPAFSRLRVFEWAPIPGEIRASELDCILDGMLQLETLGLAVSSFQNDSCAPVASTIRCNRLRSIGFAFPGKLGGPTRRSKDFFQLTISNVLSFCRERQVTEIALSTGSSDRLEWSYFPSLPPFVEMGTNVVLARYEWCTLLQRPIEISPDLFQRLTTLNISTRLLRLPNYFLPAPVLQSLCVLCDTCHECSDPRDVPENRLHLLRWDCPSLRTVHIAGPAVCAGVLLPSGRIPCPLDGTGPFEIPCAAVMRLLASIRTPGRLDKLTISGVRVTEKCRASLKDYIHIVDVIDYNSNAELLRALETLSPSDWDSPSQIFDPAFRWRDLAWAEVRAPACDWI